MPWWVPRAINTVTCDNLPAAYNAAVTELGDFRGGAGFWPLPTIGTPSSAATTSTTPAIRVPRRIRT